MLLEACGAAPQAAALLPSQASAAAHARGTADTATGMPGDTATGMPGYTATGMPGDTATGMPGDTATALPGSKFSCAPATEDGSASCTAAINVNIAPISDPNTPVAMIPGLHPADLQSAYALPVQSPGATVAIVDAFDDPFAEADLAIYRAAFGLRPCTTANGCFRKVNQRGQIGAYPAADAGWSQEISLDLDMVSAACPNCSIVLVEAESSLMDDLGASVDAAVALGAPSVSNSYYAKEWANERAEDVHYDHPGIALTASSGDRGTSSYPAASQFVTSVGGTSLSASSSGWSETAWTYSGRGCSPYVAKPGWQSFARCSKRSAVDVAVVADPQTGVAMYDAQAGGWLVAGGTSVGAPLVAAAYALSGNPAGPGFSYTHSSGFRSLTGSRYDAITGLGALSGLGGL